MTYAIIAAVIILVLWLVFKTMAASHRKWLLNQSPVGTWVYEGPDGKITLQFNKEADTNIGTYLKLTEQGEGTFREFGSWSAELNNLRMLVMASEQQEKHAVGQELCNAIRYVGPEEIVISEKETDYQFKKAPADLKLDFGDPKDIT